MNVSNFFYSLIIYPLTQIIELVFCFCNKLFDNEGFSLIGVSLAVSMLTLPLYIVAEAWQQVERDKQALMKNQIDRIKAVFKGNEQYMILTTYYRECHYHPIMGLRSAFGLLIQIPFFTAAYSCLSTMEALKGQSFFFIRDMGSPDATFMIGNFAVNVLPIAMTLINVVASAIYLKGLGFRDKIQTYGLALLFLALLYNSPSGLVVYWTMNNVFSLVKNVFYKLKNPVKVLYWLGCACVTALILFLIFGHPLYAKGAALIAGVFSIIYFIPLIVRLCNYILDTILVSLKENIRQRTVLFMLSSFALSVLVGFYVSTNLISSSPIEFSGIDGYGSPMFFVWNTFFQAVGLCFIWPVLVYFLFKERIQTLLSVGFFVILLASILDIFIFPENYGTLSKLLTFTDVANVDSPLIRSALNLLVIGVAFALAIALLKFRIEKIYTYVSALLLFVLFAISAINISTISRGYKEYLSVAQSESTDSIKPVFNFSRHGKNVLLIFLDRSQNGYVESIFEKCPQLDAQMSGFTLYRNTVSYNSHTLMASPACYGGYEYTPESINKNADKTLIEKQNESILMLPRIFTEQYGYDATVADPQWANYSWIPDLSIFNDYPEISSTNLERKYLGLWYQEHKDTARITVTSDTLKRNILWYGLFRASPLFLRPAFYNDGKYWSTNTKNGDFDDYLAGYSTLEYLDRLSTFDNEKNSFITMSNECTHQSIILQAPEYRPSSKPEIVDTGSKYDSNKAFHSLAGALSRLGEFFEVLKENGCYDNTRIIIYADHGCTGLPDGFPECEKFKAVEPGKYHPLLMVKDFNSVGALKTDDSFMTNADVPFLAVKDMEVQAVNPFTGNPVKENKENGALICTSRMFMPHHISSKNIFTANSNEWWRVKDDIHNPDNWIQE